jgi:hypothetical protein
MAKALSLQCMLDCLQVALVVDKQTLEAFGFGMVPEAAIAGTPECQSTEVTFTVLATKSWVLPGPLELTQPLQIKGGPAVLLTLRALLVVPEVVPSSDMLDFGSVSSGHCKVRALTAVLATVTLMQHHCLTKPMPCLKPHGSGHAAGVGGCLTLMPTDCITAHRCSPSSCTTPVRCLLIGPSSGQQWTAQS